MLWKRELGFRHGVHLQEELCLRIQHLMLWLQSEWAIFDCVGTIPNALQSLNTQIFKEWLPGNPDYEISGNSNVEWYDCMNGEKTDPDYHSAIWIPVKRK